jgi:dienelactone hydrolase
MNDSGNMLGAYGEWAASFLNDLPILSFRRNTFKNLSQWREQANQKITQLLNFSSIKGIPRVLEKGQIEFEGLIIKDLEWTMPYGPPSRAYLLKPKKVQALLPGILALHDHGGNKYFGRRKIVRYGKEEHPMMKQHREEYYGGRAWANELAKLGYVVLVPDAFAFGSRRILGADFPYSVYRYSVPDSGSDSELDRDDIKQATAASIDVSTAESPEEIRRYNKFAAVHEHIMAKSLFCAGLTWPGVFLSEDRFALNYLNSLPEVDSNRIGACGLSGGGLRTDYIAGIDERIAVSVSVGFMSTWKDFLLNKSHTHTWMLYIPHISRYLDFPEILGLRCPKPSLVLQTTEDPLYTLDEAKRAEEILNKVYSKAASNNFRMSYYPGPHKFDVPMQEEAFSWFENHL